MSEKNFGIIGKDLSPEDLEKANEIIGKAREKGTESINGELEKVPNMMKVIDTVNELLEQELTDLGLPQKQPIKPERVHFLSDNDYIRAAKNDESGGEYSPKEDRILVNASKTNVFMQSKILLHEAVHAISAKPFHAKRIGSNIELSPQKVGYTTFNTSERDHEHFRSLSEAVTEKIVKEILEGNRSLILEKFNINEQTLSENITYPEELLALLDKIIIKVEEKKGYAPGEYWEKLKRGILTGDMLHLRDIEDVFGKGGLRFLAALGPGGIKKMPEKELSKLIEEYFETESKERRDEIAIHVLSERERFRYKKRIES